jgi:hypothetical protein
VYKSASDVDRFGYGALHYIIQLKKKTSGARQEDLKNLLCEIQIRTVLQDSWAIFDHHLRYKREGEVPHSLRRRIYSLAALLENADSQFNELSKERGRYIRLLSSRSKISNLLDEELNRDSLLVYLKKKFPGLKVATDNDHLNVVLRGINFDKYKTIRDVDSIIKKTEEARKKYKRDSYAQTAAAHLALALACVDPAYRSGKSFGSEAKKVISSYSEMNKSLPRRVSRPATKSPQGNTPPARSRKQSTSKKRALAPKTKTPQTK